MQTYTGKVINPVNPDPRLLDIIDVAHHLSLQCRYGGASKVFYSVAEHSVRVAEQLETDSERLWGLLHDATEAYLIDLPSPLKSATKLGELYRELEFELETAVVDRFSLWPAFMPSSVSVADRQLLATERRDLLTQTPEAEELWSSWLTDEPLPGKIEPWDSRTAEAAFLAMYVLLDERRSDDACDCS